MGSMFEMFSWLDGTNITYLDKFTRYTYGSYAGQYAQPGFQDYFLVKLGDYWWEGQDERYFANNKIHRQVVCQKPAGIILLLKISLVFLLKCSIKWFLLGFIGLLKNFPFFYFSFV